MSAGSWAQAEFFTIIQFNTFLNTSRESNHILTCHRRDKKRNVPRQNGAGKSQDAPLPGVTMHVSTAWPSRTYPITQL